MAYASNVNERLVDLVLSFSSSNKIRVISSFNQFDFYLKQLNK